MSDLPLMIVQALARIVREEGLVELEFESGDLKVRLVADRGGAVSVGPKSGLLAAVPPGDPGPPSL